MFLAVRDIFWRLIPANPIFLRIIAMAGKRRRDMLIRCSYLGLLCVFVIFWMLANGGESDLGKLAQASATTFSNLSYVQLALVALLAPVFTAGAITQEGDSQTYDILLSTPLSNAQIVLGSMFSRVFFIIALLLSGVPVFAITQIFGGVGLDNILYSFGIAAGTAFITGAIAMALSTFRLGTRRTIFGFYLFIVIYMVGLMLLDRVPQLQIAGGAIARDAQSHISWFTGLNPFLALRSTFGDDSYLPPQATDLPAALRFWPMNWYLTSPHTFYISFTFFLGLALTVPSVVFLRRVAQATLSVKQWFLLKLRLVRSVTNRKPRYVWHNPVAWREAKTKASAARMTWLRYGLIIAGFAGALWTLTRFATVNMPPQYLGVNAFNSEQHLVTILSRDRATTHPYSPILTMMLDDKPVAITQLSGRYGVKDYSIDPRDRSTITTIRLTQIQRGLSLAETQSYLLKLLLLEMAVVVIVITNVAASTVTREKEDSSLDLLLASPITSRYYLWGKLRGLMSLALPLNLVPVVSIVVFVVYDIYRWLTEGGNFSWVVFPEAIVLVPIILVILTALGAVVGMEMSLRCRRTVTAVMSSVGITVGVVGLLALLGNAVLDSHSMSVAPLLVAAFSPISAVWMLASPLSTGSLILTEGGADDILASRMTIFIGSLVAMGIYAAIIWAVYRAMLKNFDMTIRRQSR